MRQPAVDTGNPILDRIYRAATCWSAGTAMGIALLVFFGLDRFGPYAKLRAHTAGANLPEARPGYTADELVSFIGDLGEAGRGLYLRCQLWDLIVPVLLGAALVLLFALLIQKTGSTTKWLRRLALVPLVYVVTDLAEDIALILFLRTYPAESMLTYVIPLLTTVKLIALGGLLLGFLALVAVIVCKSGIGQHTEGSAH